MKEQRNTTRQGRSGLFIASTLTVWLAALSLPAAVGANGSAVAAAPGVQAQADSLTNDPVLDELIQSRKRVTITQLKSEEIHALIELNDLEQMKTVDAWEKKAQQANAQSSSEASPGGDLSSALASLMRPSPTPPAPVLGGAGPTGLVPTLIGISGSGTAVHARVRYPWGTEAQVQQGDDLETGHKVVKVSPKELVLSRAGKQTTLKPD